MAAELGALQHKVIWVMSPEQWSDMRLSKHHYAEALAERGNKVYFLEPGNKFSTQVQQRTVGTNLTVVNHPLKARGWGKLPGVIYKWLIKKEVNVLLKAGVPAPDVVWCFDPLRAAHLSCFKKAFTIYHPVDHFDDRFVERYPVKPQLALTSIKREADKMLQRGWKATFVHHGLAPAFEQLAAGRMDELKNGTFSFPTNKERLKVGFSGNLLGEASDRTVMKAIIEKNPDVDFHFWGKYKNESSYISLGDHHPEFVDFLMVTANVTLHGAVNSAELAKGLHQMDMLWMVWRRDEHVQWNAHTNPHKVMEYLSTGVPVVTHLMHIYESEGLIDMAPTFANVEKFEQLFYAAKQRLLNHAHAEQTVIRQRIEFALSNTYSNLLSRIEQFAAQR